MLSRADALAAFEKGNAQPLIDWFNDGAGGAINWCSPGDFEDCVAEAGKHLDNPEGFCNERHQDACGGPPGSEDHSMDSARFSDHAAMVVDLAGEYHEAEPAHSVRDAVPLAREDGPMPDEVVPLTRSQIIALAGGSVPPPPPEHPAKPAVPVASGDSDAEDADETADATVAAKIDSAITAVKDAIKTQGTDTDTPADAAVATGLANALTALQAVAKDQDTDASTDTDSPAPPAPKAPPEPPKMADGTVPGNANGIPGDADDSPPSPGDIEDTVACENPNCKHLASAHNDTPEGKNQGACASCDCPGMVPPADVITEPATETPAAAAPEAPNPVAAADAPEGTSDDAPAPPPSSHSAPASGDRLPAPNPTPSLQGPMFTIPVAVIEGLPTGDGRGISEGALDWLDPPRPLMGLFTETHDPNGFDQNAPAEWVGSIESFSRHPDDNGVIMAQGHLLTTDEGTKAAQIIDQMGRVPVSADIIGRADRPIETSSVLDDMLPEIPVVIPGIELDAVPDAAPSDEAPAEDAEPSEPKPEAMPGVLETLTQGTVAGITIVPTSAFEQCFIVLGDGSDQPPISQLVNRTPAPAAAGEEPKPVTASMSYVLHDLEDCEPCATGKPVLVASAGGPIAPPKSWFDDPAFGPDDPRLRETTDDRTGKLSGKFACPPTITEDGEVLMHIAQWGVCHTGPQYRGKCMLAPRNHSGYAYWYQGAQVLTAEGELVDVGPITIGTGHAKLNLGLGDTLSHYDHTGTAVAYGSVGEDEYGIWFHGALSPDATPEQVFKLRASVPSGDWRPRGNREELCAALMVNRAGFPQARAYSVNGRKTALVAAGAPMFDETAPAPKRALSFAERFALIERTQLPLVHAALKERMAALRAG